MDNYLKSRQDYILLDKLTYVGLISRNNLIEEMRSFLLSSRDISDNANRSIQFLVDNLTDVTEASKALDKVEGMLQNIDYSVDGFILSKKQLKDGSDTSFSFVDLTTGNFENCEYSINEKAIVAAKREYLKINE